VPVVFIRALVQSGNTAPIDALIECGMLAEGRPAADAVFVHS